MSLRIILCLLLFFVVDLSYAQLSTRSKRAKKFYQESSHLINRRQYPEAIQVLKRAVDKDENFYEAHLRLGSIYKILNYYPESADHYEKVIALAPGKYKNAYFELGEVYFLQGKYQEAAENMQLFLQGSINKDEKIREKASKILESAEYAAEKIKEPLDFDPKPLSDVVNQFPLQYFPVLTADDQSIIYTRRTGSSAMHDEDIYISKKNDEGNWSDPRSISNKINTQFNEGTCTISADGRTIIFTSCQGRKTFGSCDLFVSYKTGDQWSIPENLGDNINSRAWESQPSLSADGRTLYFISNRPGGQGGRDIWVSYKDGNNEWSEAVNLGKAINTNADEVSPFIHVNGKTLFFASKGYKGFGGFDLYFSEKENNTWKKPENLGFPINTHEDQVSLFITSGGNKAYYALDSRQGGMLVSSKLYSFNLPEEIQPSVQSNYVTGRIFDAETKEYLSAEVELYDIESDSLASKVNSDKVSGEYMIIINEGSEYALYVNKKGYLFKSLSFDYSNEGQPEPVKIDIPLDPIKKGTVTTLKNIFFEVDSYQLKEKSITELNKVVQFLNNNPEVAIEIEGHTDNTGTADYNMELSLKRARSVYDFLVKSGIDEERISYKGYGQTQPKVPNDSEQNKSLNRRIEFKIL